MSSAKPLECCLKGDYRLTFIYGLEVIFILGFSVVFRLLSDLEPLPFWLFLSVLISYLLARYYEEEKQALKISSYISLVFVTIVTGFSAAILYLDPSLSHRLFACSVLFFSFLIDTLVIFTLDARMITPSNIRLGSKNADMFSTAMRIGMKKTIMHLRKVCRRALGIQKST